MTTEPAIGLADTSPAQLLDWTRRLQAELRRRMHAAEGSLDLLAWGRRYLARYMSRPPSAMHVWLAAQLDESCRQRGMKLNAIGPRGGAKSTLVTLAHVLRVAVEGLEPYIWIVSDTRRQAHLHLDHVKTELLENVRLAADYPRAVGKGRVWRAGAAQLANGVLIEAFGTGQGIRGRRSGSHRPTLIVCDDLQNDQHAESRLLRQRTAAWFSGTLLKAGTKCTSVVNLATALHHDALALHLAATPGWVSRTFPAIIRWPDDTSGWEEWQAIYSDVENPHAKRLALDFYQRHRERLDAGAELLWPEEEDLYTLKCLMVEGGRTAFEREKQGSPANPELYEFPEDYFGQHMWFDDWPGRWQVKTMALDPSKGSDARRGDFSAFVMLALGADSVMYVEADLARRPTPQIVADGVAHYRRFGPDAFGVEANQFQDLLADDFTAEFERQGLLAARPWTLDNRVAKAVRIRRLGPWLSARRMRFKTGSAGTRLLVDQLRQFPVADHDDGPDALEMALRLVDMMLGGSGDGLGDRLPIDFGT